MQHPILQLQALLTSRKPPVTGRVVRTNGTEVSVATDKGVVISKRDGDGTDYKAGDRVALRDGQLIGRLRDESDIPVFFI